MSFRWLSGAAAIAFLIAGLHGRVLAFPVDGDQTTLPAKTELNEDALSRPREVFHSEITGRRSDLIKLGNLAFSSPSILGPVAQQAGISCETCHVNGAGNAKFFMPKMSTRPGNFDTTGALFNPKADNAVLDPVRIPSLRGARYLAPYGADGRLASLRDFVRNVIVNEFAGAEPSPAIVDAIVAYIHDIDFLPNPNLGPGGRLVGKISESERRGEALFSRPFPHDAGMSCAACHVPSAAFVDHQQHDVGTGGLFKTPTLRNADFNAPYFHDGRFDTYGQVVAHFDKVFDLGLSAQDQKDLVAYLTAVGDGLMPYEPGGAGASLKEIGDFASLLGRAIPAGDKDVVSLAVDTIGGELRELTEQYPDRKDTSVAGGEAERANARAALKEAVLLLRRIDMAVGDGRTADALADYQNYRSFMAAAVPSMLAYAEPFSLFNAAVHDRHYGALRQVMQSKHMSQ
ncbi:cytochrome c peroxidase [Bradyrhizobium erythrophlei]|uniref:Cytochrome c peroxidase n=1 Tax=Bradyrhizobium erythrophlei TaxID=1437360 RepID=A0A1M7U878_9BRAD|nr:cytochrome c peroxidase [Bradyrhizobium erythrophlei]SHN79282.1 Cytochrome c peroxidase [Bradyrhizobium erythrophlei]